MNKATPTKLANLVCKIKVSLYTLAYVGIACILVGILLAPHVMPQAVTTSVNHATHSHQALEVSSDLVPQVTVLATQDAMAGWNVKLELKHFQLTPAQVNQENVANTGHAHLYINGEKTARLYSEYFHIARLAPGQNHIMVSLNANNHSQLTSNGKPVQGSTIVVNQ